MQFESMGARWPRSWRRGLGVAVAGTVLGAGTLAARADVVTFENTAQVTCADGGFAVSSVNVSGINGTVTKIVAEFQIWHTSAVFDLDVKLRHPNLIETMLISDLDFNGGFADANFVVDDDAPGLFPFILSNPAGSTFLGRPTDYDLTFDNDPPLIGGPGPLSRYNAVDPNGQWLLIITDDHDQPTINPFSIFQNFRVRVYYEPVPAPGAAGAMVIAAGALLARRRGR